MMEPLNFSQTHIPRATSFNRFAYYCMTQGRLPQGNAIAPFVLILFALGLASVGLLLFLPLTISCGSNAALAEAKNFVGTMNRAQMAYYLEHQQFANSLNALAIGLPAETLNYRYRTQAVGTVAFSYAIARYDYTRKINKIGPFQWATNGYPLRSYVVATVLVSDQQKSASTKPAVYPNGAILCQVRALGPVPVNPPTYRNGQWQCGAGSDPLLL